MKIKFIYRLDSKQSFYWYSDGSLLTSEGVNYFQIADNICDLDFKKANAECSLPIGILKLQNDSIFIVSQDSIIEKKKNSDYKIIKVDYEFKLRDKIEKPNYRAVFFLKDTCRNK